MGFAAVWVTQAASRSLKSCSTSIPALSACSRYRPTTSEDRYTRNRVSAVTRNGMSTPVCRPDVDKTTRVVSSMSKEVWCGVAYKLVSRPGRLDTRAARRLGVFGFGSVARSLSRRHVKRSPPAWCDARRNERTDYGRSVYVLAFTRSKRLPRDNQRFNVFARFFRVTLIEYRDSSSVTIWSRCISCPRADSSNRSTPSDTVVGATGREPITTGLWFGVV